ncbi:MAG: ATP-binding protein [bacterium]
MTVVKEVERINRLIEQMMDMVRKPAHDRDLVDIKEVIERLLVVVHPECQRNGIEIKVLYSEDLPNVMVLAGELYQAILNVIMNSVQAMANGGTLTIITERVQENIICRISDTGPGVPPENLSRIFEPLYTTKEGGHGLGLALTYQFIRSNGGEVRAESVPGSGLTINMILPAYKDATQEVSCT